MDVFMVVFFLTFMNGTHAVAPYNNVIYTDVEECDAAAASPAAYYYAEEQFRGKIGIVRIEPTCVKTDINNA